MNRTKRINRTFLGKIDGEEVFCEGPDHELVRDLIGGQALEISELNNQIAELNSIIKALEGGKSKPEAPRIIIPGA